MLELVRVTPTEGTYDVAIDSSIVLEFDGYIDPFTVTNGIALYTSSSGIWSGPSLAIQDTQFSDVLTTGDQYNICNYSYTIDNTDPNGSKLTLKPLTSLEPEQNYYISIFPGNDPSRYLSTATVAKPVYERVSSSDGAINILSAYSGKDPLSYILSFSGPNKFDLTSGLTYIPNQVFSFGQPFNIGDLIISITGTFEAGDTVSIYCIPAQGVQVDYKMSFQTSKYELVVPGSKSVQFANDFNIPLQVIRSTPEDQSIHNESYNPITITFNKLLDPDLNFNDYISIKRTDLITGEVRRVGYYYRIVDGNKMQIFMTSVNGVAYIK